MKKTLYIVLAILAVFGIIRLIIGPKVICDFCDVEYRENLGYTRTFADDEDEKWYYCPDCYKEFSYYD